MVKIKRKVEMNEKELIKHLVNHESTTICLSGISYDISYDGDWVSIEPEIASKIHFEFKDVSANGKTFTVETYKEITENTEFETLVEVTKSGNVHSHHGANIEEEACKSSVEFHALINGELVLIWKNGRLVE